MVGGKRKSAELFRKSKRVQESRDRESAEGSENGIMIVAPARGLGCLIVRASWNSIFMQQSCLVLPSTLALPFCIGLKFLLVLAAL